MKFRVENAKGETAKAVVGKGTDRRKETVEVTKGFPLVPFLHGRNELGLFSFDQSIRYSIIVIMINELTSFLAIRLIININQRERSSMFVRRL